MGAVASGVRIEVEPDALTGAGKQLGSLGTQLGMLSDALGSVVSGGIASGTDPAGLDFGLKYGDQAQQFASALAEAANAVKSVGFMLEATGHNYENADAASTVGGSGPTGGVGSPPSEIKAGDAATGPNSNTVSPPTKWHLIVPFLNALPGGMVAAAALTWPSGNSGMMRLTAAQWRNLGQGLSVFDDAVAPVKSLVAAQRIHEGGKIDEVLGRLSQAVSGLSTNASALAQLIDDFAGGVQETQDAIRRLLDRISLDGAWDMVKGVFTGEADDILREVARDVGTVLEHFQRQVKGVVGLLGELTSALGDAVTALQNWVRPRLEELLGDEVGGALADAFTMYTDFQVGLTTGLINTVAGTVAMADPDTWKGMAETVMSVAEDPSKLPGVLADMGAEFVALDKWSSDHPGRAAGEAAFNIGSLFVPGGALSKTGTLAKGLSATRGLLDSGRIPGLRGLGSGSGTPGVENLPELDGAGPRLPEVPEVRPPAIPKSLLGPTAPNSVDAPSSPRGLEGPAGPPGARGQATTPGGNPPPASNNGSTPDTSPAPNAATQPDAATSPSPGQHAGDYAPGHGAPNTVDSNGHSDARQHMPTEPPAAGMAEMAATAPHAPAATHGPSGAHSSETSARGAESRTPDTRTPDARAPDAKAPATRAPDVRITDADGFDRAGVRGGQTDGQASARAPDLSAPVAHHDSPDPAGPGSDRVSADGGVVDRSARTDATTPADDPEANIPPRTDGLAVERGGVTRGVDEPTEPGSMAGG